MRSWGKSVAQYSKNGFPVDCLKSIAGVPLIILAKNRLRDRRTYTRIALEAILDTPLRKRWGIRRDAFMLPSTHNIGVLGLRKYAEVNFFGSAL